MRVPLRLLNQRHQSYLGRPISSSLSYLAPFRYRLDGVTQGHSPASIRTSQRRFNSVITHHNNGDTMQRLPRGPTDTYLHIQNSLDESMYKTWGFVIYRCSYDDDAAWRDLVAELQAAVAYSLEDAGRVDLGKFHELTIIEDKHTLNNVSPYEVRRQFRKWCDQHEDKDKADVNSARACFASLPPRFRFCLAADKRALHSESIKLKFIWLNFASREDDTPEWDEDMRRECLAEEFGDSGELNVGWKVLNPYEYVGQYEECCSADDDENDWLVGYIRPRETYREVILGLEPEGNGILGLG